jgi:hypothetical protein
MRHYTQLPSVWQCGKPRDMPNINLLPINLVPKVSVVRFASGFKKASIIMFGLFSLAALGLGGWYVFNAIEISTLQKTEADLKASVILLEATEQKMVLVRDRLDKIQKVWETDDSSVTIAKLKEIAEIYPADTKIGNITAGRLDIDQNLILSSSSSVNNLFSQLDAMGSNYEKIELVSLVYSPAVGYATNLKFSLK